MTHKSYRSYFGCRSVCCLLVAGLLLPLSVLADAIVGNPVDWDTHPPSTAWAPIGSSATAVEDTLGADDYLKITFPGGIDPGPGSQWYETVKGPSADLFALTWESDNWIEFDFWANDVLPDTLQLRWGADGTGRTWGNTVSPTAGVGSWGTIKTDNFSDYQNWQLSPFDSSADFVADLNSIDWIGVYIFRDGTDQEIYGVDDFKLMVPEPAEYLMLAAALLTAFLVIRQKKLEAVSVRAA